MEKNRILSQKKGVGCGYPQPRGPGPVVGFSETLKTSMGAKLARPLARKRLAGLLLPLENGVAGERVDLRTWGTSDSYWSLTLYVLGEILLPFEKQQ
jgi:hypothetical protein